MAMGGAGPSIGTGHGAAASTTPACSPLFATSSTRVLAPAPENEVMQLNDREHRIRLAIRPDADRHLALDGKVHARPRLNSGPGLAQFAPKQPAGDWPCHAELLDHARPGAAHLVADGSITCADAKMRDGVLHGVGPVQVHAAAGLSKPGARRSCPVVLPLPVRDLLNGERPGDHTGALPAVLASAVLAAVWPNRSFLPSSVTAGCVNASPFA